MKNIFSTIRQWHRDNAAAMMLYRLSDGMLDDMGLARANLRRDIHIFH